MNRTWLEIQATLLEDLHAGSGLGMAGIDALLQRDRYGRPMVSRTHLEGLLRASVSDPDIITQLFGQPGGPGQRALFTSLRVNEAAENINTRTWYATARTAFDNRAPLEDTLRIIEYIPAGTVLSGKILLPEELVAPFESILQRCAYLGAGRRRGDGLVRFNMKRLPPPTGQKLPLRNGYLRLRLLLRAVEPLCLAKTGQPGRIIPTEPFIRGQRLQGALIDWILNWNGGPTTAGTIDWDAVSVGDGLPLPPAIETDNLSGIEVLPIPLYLVRDKPTGASGQLPWWAQNSVPPPSQDGFNTEKRLKRPMNGECVARLGTGPWYRYSPLINVHLRNAQGTKPRRPPSLFSVEEIAEDTRFVTDIDFDSASVADTFVQVFREILEGRDWLTVGRGKAPVIIEEAVWVDQPNQVEAPYPAGTAVSPFRLTLTSDLLFLDDWLCWETHLTGEKLKQLVGIPKAPDIRIRSFEDVVEVQGFNAASGLPRTPAYAIKRGSSYRIDGSGASDLFRSLSSKKALGERTQLGFGRFRLDPDDTPPGLPEVHPQAGSRPSALNAERDERLLERALALAEKVKEPPDGPSRSQWWALRDAIRSCVSSQDVRDRIESLGRTQGGRVWCIESVKPVLEALKECSNPEDAASLADAIIRWIFPKARGVEYE